MIYEKGCGATLPDGVSYAVDRFDKEQWHELLQSFTDASIMQSSSYATGRWPASALSHLVVSRSGKPVAAAQVILRSIPLLGGGLAYVHFGPLWQMKGEAPDLANLELVLRCLCAEYLEKRRMVLRIRPWPSREEDDLITPLMDSFRFRRHVDASPDRFLVNVGQTSEALRADLQGKWRYNLKKSYKHDLRVDHLKLDEGLGPFMTLYEDMQTRKAFFDTSAIEDLPAIYSDLPEVLKPDVWLCSLDGEPVAGAVVSLLGDTTQYLFGASTDQSLKVNAGFRLHWEIAQWAGSQGGSWYDLGGDSGSAGLRQFKTGMVGRSGRIVPLPGDFESSGSLSSIAAVKLALRYREAHAAASKLAQRWRPARSV